MYHTYGICVKFGPPHNLSHITSCNRSNKPLIVWCNQLVKFLFFFQSGYSLEVAGSKYI